MINSFKWCVTLTLILGKSKLRYGDNELTKYVVIFQQFMSRSMLSVNVKQSPNISK